MLPIYSIAEIAEVVVFNLSNQVNISEVFCDMVYDSSR